MTKKLVIIVGPTGVGKSALAMELAYIYKTPIISADSRQIYKQLDIGTGKPSKEDLINVKHYFIDAIDIDQEFNVGEYAKECLALIDELFKTHNIVLICGGTGLYIHAILNGLDNFPVVEKKIRENLYKDYERFGLDYLINELKKCDPVYLNEVDQKNSRRLIRALEVYQSSGIPYSDFLNKSKSERLYETKEVYLKVNRNILYEKINQRVDQMIGSGLLEEVKSLKDKKSYQALNTVGYQEIFSYFEGKYTLNEAIEKIKQHTRNYAKRQITWFNKFSQGQIFDPLELDKIMEYINE